MLEWQLFHHCGQDKIKFYPDDPSTVVSRKYEKKGGEDLEDLAKITGELKKVCESQKKLIHSVDQRGVIRNNGDLVRQLSDQHNRIGQKDRRTIVGDIGSKLNISRQSQRMNDVRVMSEM